MTINCILEKTGAQSIAVTDWIRHSARIPRSSAPSFRNVPFRKVVEDNIVSYLDSIFADAKEEANRLCTLDFRSFADYREITEDDLPSDKFYDDEWKQQQSVMYKSFFAPAVLLLASVVLFIVWTTNPMQFGFILASLILLGVGLFGSFLVFKRSRDIQDAGYNCSHLGRGVILCKTTVRSNAASTMTRGAIPNIRMQNRTDNRAVFHFVSVFFPDTKTYIRNVFCSDGGLRNTFGVGDTVAVYRHADSGEADLLPSTHVTVPPELMAKVRVEQVRKAPAIRIKPTVNKKAIVIYFVIILVFVIVFMLLIFAIPLISRLANVPIHINGN